MGFKKNWNQEWSSHRNWDGRSLQPSISFLLGPLLCHISASVTLTGFTLVLLHRLTSVSYLLGRKFYSLRVLCAWVQVPRRKITNDPSEMLACHLQSIQNGTTSTGGQRIEEEDRCESQGKWMLTWTTEEMSYKGKEEFNAVPRPVQQKNCFGNLSGQTVLPKKHQMLGNMVLREFKCKHVTEKVETHYLWFKAVRKDVFLPGISIITMKESLAGACTCVHTKSL